MASEAILSGSTPDLAETTSPQFSCKRSEYAGLLHLRREHMRKYDVVYVLKEGADPSELRYSLRSIEKNMTHGDVWFYGGNPKGFVPDHAVRFVQKGFTKWDKVRSTLMAICKNDDIPDRFWLFNDDFYIMKRMTSTKPYYNKTLKDHYKHVEQKHGGRTAYSKALRYCEEVLKSKGCDTLDYAIHIPILVEKKKLLETLEVFPHCPMYRSLYGNYNKLDGVHHADVKISDLDKAADPDTDYLSTSNKSFRIGKVGEQLREWFPDPCRYEAE